MTLHNTMKKVLIVDDEPEILELNKEAFEFFGFEVYTAQSVSEAVEVLNKIEVDYILSDYMMPIQNGLDLAKIVRNKMKLKVPISFLTAYSLATKQEINELGVQKIFSKPLDIDEVVVYIQKELMVS